MDERFLDIGLLRFLIRKYSSSVCVYNQDRQTDPGVTGLKEADAYPAMPEDGYGWEKLFSERMCRHFTEDFGLITRIARSTMSSDLWAHTTAVAKRPRRSFAERVIEVQLSGRHEIEIWGRDFHQNWEFQGFGGKSKLVQFKKSDPTIFTREVKGEPKF